MQVFALEQLPEREVVSGYRARFVHTAAVSLAYWTVRAKAALPAHAHPQEQTLNLLEGRFALTVEGETNELVPGQVVIIPPNAPHSGLALTDCRILDVFFPIREDYR